MTEKIDVLSHHDAICEFTGIQHIPCRFRTALCPDRCDHASDVAMFKVLEYKNYELKGKYGDEKQERWFIGLKEQDDDEGAQTKEVIDKIKALKPGQKVKLWWDHIYVTDENGQHPERPVKLIEPI